MASRSATVLVIFTVAVLAFCSATVVGSMTGPLNLFPQNSGGVLDNLSAITDGKGNEAIGSQSYNDYSEDYSSSDNVESYSEPSQDTSQHTESSQSQDQSQQDDSHHDSTPNEDSSKTDSGNVENSP